MKDASPFKVLTVSSTISHTQFVLNGWSRVYRDDGGLRVGAWGLDEVDGDLGLRDRWGGWP